MQKQKLLILLAVMEAIIAMAAGLAGWFDDTRVYYSVTHDERNERGLYARASQNR